MIKLIPDKNAQTLLHGFKGQRILVVGDLVLDHYLEGTVSRISPEAPVPVVAVGDSCERSIPGGAANVALNVLSLGGEPILAGVVGSDREGETLLKLLSDAGVDVSAVVHDHGRPTTVKTRVMSKNHQLMRIDREKTSFLSSEIDAMLRSRIDSAIHDVSAVILEDYDKGVLTQTMIRKIISVAMESDTHVAVDPKIRNFWNFAHCSLFKPNRHEAGIALGINIDSVDKAIDAAVEIRKRLSAESVLITLGSSGSVLVHGQDNLSRYLPTVARHVFDVSGAGDSVIAVMGLAGGSGMTVVEGAKLANLAAAAVCAEPGVYPVKPSDIVREASRFE